MKSYTLMPLEGKKILGVGVRYRVGKGWKDVVPEIVKPGDHVVLSLEKDNHLPFTIVVMSEEGFELATVCKEQRSMVKDYLDEDGTAEAVFKGMSNSVLLLELEGEKICCQKYYDNWTDDLPEELKRQTMSKRRAELSRWYTYLCKRMKKKKMEEMEPEEVQKTLRLAENILDRYRPSTCGEEHNWILGINRLVIEFIILFDSKEDYSGELCLASRLFDQTSSYLTLASDKQKVEEMFAEDWQDAEQMAEETNLIPWYLGSRETEMKNFGNPKDFWLEERKRIAGYLERALWKSIRRYKNRRGWKMGELIFYADISQTEHVMVMSLLLILDEVERQLKLLEKAEKAEEMQVSEVEESVEEDVKEEEEEGFTLPRELSTPEVKRLMDKARTADLLDENYQTKLTLTDSAMLAYRIATKAKIQNKWKVFEDFWGKKNLRNAYNKAKEQKKYQKTKEILTRVIN